MSSPETTLGTAAAILYFIGSGGLILMSAYAVAHAIFWSDTPPSGAMLWWAIALSFSAASVRLAGRTMRQKELWP